MDVKDKYSIYGVNKLLDTSQASSVENMEGRYMIGAGLYYTQSSCSLDNTTPFAQPAAHYCWCLLKQTHCRSQALLEVLKSVQIDSHEEDASLANRGIHNSNFSKIAVHCSGPHDDDWEYPNHIALLYGLAEHDKDVETRWSRVKDYLGILNSHLKEIDIYNSQNPFSANHYAYRMLSSSLGITPFVFERYPLSSKTIPIEEMQLAIERSMRDVPIEEVRVLPSSFFRHGLFTAPPSPIMQDDLPTPPMSPLG